MNLKTSKTYHIGRLIITTLPHEILFIYSGKKRVIYKNLHRSSLSGIYKKVFITALVVSVSAVLLVSFFPDSQPESPENGTVAAVSEEDPVAVDEKKKNELLQSEHTDYSIPEKIDKLQIREHRVKKGETLSHIAHEYGVSIDTICGSNNLRSYHFIRAGRLLKIPNNDGILYKVKAGNRVAEVARKYKVSVDKIITANEIKNPDFVGAGRELFIPDAKPQNIVPGFLWPTRGRFITCGYGWRRNPFHYGRKEFHQGLDIRCRYEWIKASRFGKITYTGWLGGYGNVVVIAHPGGYKTLYAHLSRVIVRRGQYVKQGQMIAKSGNTGRSTGPHLHFEIMKRGRHKNPYNYLTGRVM